MKPPIRTSSALHVLFCLGMLGGTGCRPGSDSEVLEIGWTRSVLVAPLIWAHEEGLLPPQVRFRRFSSQEALIAALRGGRLQAGIVPFHAAVRLQAERPSWRVPLVLGAASAHPILIGRGVNWLNLSRYRIPIRLGSPEHFWAERLLLERGLLPDRARTLLDPLPERELALLEARSPVRFGLFDTIEAGWSVLARAERLTMPPMEVLLISDSLASVRPLVLEALLAGWANALVRWEADPDAAFASWAALLDTTREAVRRMRMAERYRFGTPRLNQELLAPGGPLLQYQWAMHRFWIRYDLLAPATPFRPLPDSTGWRHLME